MGASKKALHLTSAAFRLHLLLLLIKLILKTVLVDVANTERHIRLLTILILNDLSF